jgi:hypothetical protein
MEQLEHAMADHVHLAIVQPDDGHAVVDRAGHGIRAL